MRQQKLIERSIINNDIKKLDDASQKLIENDALNSHNLFSEFEDLDNYLIQELKD